MNQLYFPGRMVDLYANDYQYLQDSAAEESLKFFKSFIAGNLRSAIVKEFSLRIDPSDNTKLYISQNGTTGGVITSSGLLILSDTDESGIELSDYTLGIVNSVYAVCTYIYGSYDKATDEIIENEQKIIDYYGNTLVYNRKIENLSYVVYTSSEYAALTASAKAELIYLGSTIAQGSGVALTSVDTSTVDRINLNIPDYQIDVSNLVVGFKLPQAMVYNTSTGDIHDDLSYPLLTPSNVTDDLNIVRTQIRNIKQTVNWDDYQAGGFAANPDLDVLHRTGVAPSTYNSYNDFDYSLSSSGLVITIGTGKTLISNNEHIELESTSFNIPSSVNTLISSEKRTVAATQPVTFYLSVYPLTSSGGVSLQVYSSTGELYVEGIDYSVNPTTGAVTTIVGGDIVGENVYCTYYASGYRCDVIAATNTDLVYLQGTPIVSSQPLPPLITGSDTLPLYYIYRNPLIDTISSNDIIDARVYLKAVKEVVEITSQDLTGYATSTGNYAGSHTGSLNKLTFCLTSTNTPQPQNGNWSVETMGGLSYIYMLSNLYAKTYVYTKTNDYVWVFVRPTTIDESLTLTYETTPGSGTLDGSVTMTVPKTSSDPNFFVPLLFKTTGVSEGVTEFRLVANNVYLEFWKILIGNSDLFYLFPLMEGAAANPDSYINRGSVSSTNTYIGSLSLQNYSGGTDNTAIGYKALSSNTNGIQNTAVGSNVLISNISGYGNTGIGYLSLYSNTKGIFNTGTGQQSLGQNTSGSYNTANGFSALAENTLGNYGTAIGYLALASNISANKNTSIGAKSFYWNTTGESGVALGYYAGAYNSNSNKLFIDNQDRGSEANDLSSALIVGTFDSVSANQSVTINGSLNVGNISSGGALNVRNVRWTSAREIPISGSTTSGDVNMAVTALGERYCASMSKYGNNVKLRTFYFNGYSWSSIGSPSANVFSAGNFITLTSLNATDVAAVCSYHATSLKSFRFDYSSGAWSQLSTGSVSSLDATDQGITSLTSSTIACAVSDMGSASRFLQSYTISGATWSSLGSLFIIPGTVATPAILALNSTDVVIGNSSSNSLETYRFNGATWTSFGSSLFLSGASFISLTSLNKTDIVTSFDFDGALNLAVFRFNNNNTWTSIGYSYSVSGRDGGRCIISSLNTTDIVSYGDTPTRLRLYRFDYSLSEEPYRMW